MKHVDVRPLLEEGESLSDFMADDPDAGLYKSTVSGNTVWFVQTSDFEFIFGDKRMKTAAMQKIKPSRGQQKGILDVLRSRLDVDGAPVWKSYVTNQEGGHNKFHYFAVFEKNDGYIAANASGRIGYPNTYKVVAIGFAFDKADAIKKAEQKLGAKMRTRGYKETKIASTFTVDLDLDDRSELDAWVKKNGKVAGKTLVKRLGFEGEGALDTAHALQAYVMNKRVAMQFRSIGEVERAKRHERCCNRIYVASLRNRIRSW